VSARSLVVGGSVYFRTCWGAIWFCKLHPRHGRWAGHLAATKLIRLILLPAQRPVSRTRPGGSRSHRLHRPASGRLSSSLSTAKTGDLRCMTQIDIQSGAAIDSPRRGLSGDVIHIGVSGVGQDIAVANDYQSYMLLLVFCGSEVSFNARPAAILGRRSMAPSGYTVTAIWGATRRRRPAEEVRLQSAPANYALRRSA